jgi:LPXTG-motif cell wall-anchored protein
VIAEVVSGFGRRHPPTIVSAIAGRRSGVSSANRSCAVLDRRSRSDLHLASYGHEEIEMPTLHPRVLTPSSEAHEEWLLDDAIDDTFPASDPISHGQPGSIVSARYATRERDARSKRQKSTWLLIAGAIAIGLALVFRRRRNRAGPR